MVGVLIATALLWQNQTQVEDQGSYRKSCALLWTLAPFFPAVLTNITMGQKGLLWMFLLSLVVFAWNRRFRFLSGLLFGIFALKPTLFFFLPLLMLRSRHYSFVAGATVSCFFLYGIAFLFLPFDCWEHFLGTALHATRYHEQAGYDFSWTCNLLSYLPALSSLGYPAVEWIVLLPIILFTVYRSAQKPSISANRRT